MSTPSFHKMVNVLLQFKIFHCRTNTHFFWCGYVLITIITMMTISIKAKIGKSEIINYRDASQIILDLVDLGITIPKIRWIGLSDHTKSCCQKAKNPHVFKLTYRLSGNLTILEFLRFLNCTLMLYESSCKVWNRKDNSNTYKLWTYGPTLIIEKSSPFKNY